MYRKGADYSFKEPKEPLSAPVLSPADTRSCIVIVVVVVVVVVILLLSRDLGSRQPLPYPLLLLSSTILLQRVHSAVLFVSSKSASDIRE